MDTVLVHVVVRQEKEPTGDQMALIDRHINGSVRHSKHTGLLEMRWRVPAERLLGVLETVPRIVSIALTSAFKAEGEVVSVSVISTVQQ